MLRRGQWLEGHAASAVILVVRRDERWRRRVLHVRRHRAVTLVDLRQGDTVAVVLERLAELAVLSALDDCVLHGRRH